MAEKIVDVDERRAIARLKAGDLDGMEYLVHNHQQQALFTAYLIVGDWKAAEDLVQAAFLNAATKIDQFDGNKRFGPWFLRGVINAAIKAAQRQARLVSLQEEDDETITLRGLLLDPNPQPVEIVETHETRRMVWRAITQLTPQQRAVVVMRHFLDMDEVEITRIMDRPKTTIRWWLRAARGRLQTILSPLRQMEKLDPEAAKKEDVYE
jgi:RNA polymerase sigma-70 factor, ECF subfamily